MIVRETNDIGLIKSILCHPEVYGCISCDKSMPVDEFEPPMSPEVQYVAGFVGSAIIGLMIYHDVDDKVKCHIQVLPEYRKRYAKEFARIALNFGKAKNAIIYAEIPECYPNVLRFSKAAGFFETGKIIDGYAKDSVNHNVIIVRLKNGVR